MNKTTEALKLSTVALKDIACTSQTDDLLWWQIRAREALAAIREALAEQETKAAIKNSVVGTEIKPEPLTMRLDIEASKVKTMTLEEYKEFMQPVKQESVALDEVRRIAAEYAEPNSQVDSGNLYWALCEALKYTAPVDAKAIRAEAFKEAAEWCEAKQSYSAMHANTEFAAGIRGLKDAT